MEAKQEKKCKPFDEWASTSHSKTLKQISLVGQAQLSPRGHPNWKLWQGRLPCSGRG